MVLVRGRGFANVLRGVLQVGDCGGLFCEITGRAGKLHPHLTYLQIEHLRELMNERKIAMSKSNEAKDWSKPLEIDDVNLVFPANVIGTWLPAWEEIPEEFQRERNSWCKFAQKLFFLGGSWADPKEGIDPELAVRHLSAVLSSFEPKHEHKIAGAGWLMSMWYKEQPE